MNTRRKVLLDCESFKNIPGISARDYEIVLSGKFFNYISNNDESQEIYSLIRENCDIRFCTETSEESSTESIIFYPVPVVCIFAYDSYGNYFGTFNGLGTIEDYEKSVVYLNKFSGAHGKISDNMKSFFSLVNYYPYWRSILDHEQNGTTYNLSIIEREDSKDESYFKRQKEIGEALNLSRDPNAIIAMIENLRRQSEFKVYASKKEAEVENEFIEI